MTTLSMNRQKQEALKQRTDLISCLVSLTTTVNFHTICTIIVRQVNFFGNKINLTTVSAFTLATHGIANILGARITAQSFDNTRNLSHLDYAYLAC